VVGGLFILDKLLTVTPEGGLEIDADTQSRLDLLVGEFVRAALL
jgi:hypothetical protein